MPHQCTKCSRFIPVGSKELLEGCGNCKSKFFFYIKEEQLEKIRNNPIEIPEDERKIVERDIRDIAGITDESMPVILDIESIRAIGSGKFEIDVVNLFNKDRPLIYKFEEGKYLIDLATTLRQNMKNKK
ncbi:MAG TPA: Zn-ribbon containing protein [Candidatus Nanoarchaeia archaeon]|nr:Zn-ribbon containing protein [Candidatus Nanoarchaeia archaeon]